MDKLKEKYDGACDEDFTHVKELSCYNSNYYINGKDLLYGDSDDDNTTTWYYLDKSSMSFICIGYSLCSEGDIIHFNGNADR